MAPIVPNPKRIKGFRTAAAFEAWLRANHDSGTEIWLKIHKKDTALPTVTYAQALEVALCWGWIDGIRKSFDERSFLQRFTPRGAGGWALGRRLRANQQRLGSQCPRRPARRTSRRTRARTRRSARSAA
ncbi:hypothetical protein BH11GEM1_BH11GEM1_03730 [soil metagenome]